MKAIITNQPDNVNADKSGAVRTPRSYIGMAKKLLEKLRSTSGPNEIRALAVDKVASPVLQVLF